MSTLDDIILQYYTFICPKVMLELGMVMFTDAYKPSQAKAMQVLVKFGQVNKDSFVGCLALQSCIILPPLFSSDIHTGMFITRKVNKT